MTTDRTTYHVMIDEDDGSVMALFRWRCDSTGSYPEAYHPGKGWVESRRVTDVFRNGQDYDLIDEAEAERLAAKMESREE